MTCDSFKIYGSEQILNYPVFGSGKFGTVYSEQWFDDWPRQLALSGMTCEFARAYIKANWNNVSDGNGNLFPRYIVKAETFVELCGAAAWNGGSGGTFNTRDTELLSPTEIGGLNSAFNCTPLQALQADGTWGQLWFAGFVSTASTWLPTVECIQSIDIDKWFCCRTECCGSTIPGGSGGFIIPKPTLIPPVDDKASIPILNNPLYLANHTWAFRNNFGRIPK